MYKRLLYVFLFALAIAGGASFLVYRMILGSAQNQSKHPAGVTAVVALRPIQIGELIRDTDVKEVYWTDPLPDGSLKKVSEAVGRGAVAPIYRNEPIVQDRLAMKGAGAGLAATIPIGKRAVALRANEVIGLAGFVQPGMRVDVIVAWNSPITRETKLGTLSRTVLQNIEVLSAGQKITKSVDGKPDVAQVVNLLVTPDQAEVLSLAGAETRVQLVLRNPLDTTEEVTHGTSVSSLFGEVPEAPVKHAPVYRVVAPKPVPVKTMHTIEIFNGPKRTSESIDVSKDGR